MDIHLLHKHKSFDGQGPLGPTDSGSRWQSGYWKIGKNVLEECIGANIYFHDKQADPSYQGGVISSYRIVDKGEYEGRVVFEFEPREQHLGVIQTEDWFLEKSVRRENGRWSTAELGASVDAYAEMYRAYQEGRKVNKRQMYRDLEEQFGRKDKAFERRMMNISHVVKVLGGEPVKGLLPASNVGQNIYPILERLVIEEGFLAGKTVEQVPTTYETDSDVLDQKAAKLLADWKEKQSKILPPKGLATPLAKQATTTVRERSPEVKAWVLMASGYDCECCGKEAPFRKEDGTPYLEVHHVVTLAERGSDTIENAVAVCPDCHRALHYSRDRQTLIENLYSSVGRLIRP